MADYGTGGKIHFSSEYANLQAALTALSAGDVLLIDKSHDLHAENDAGLTLSTNNVTLIWLNADDVIDGSGLAAGAAILAIAGSGKTAITDNLIATAYEGAASVSIGSGNEADYSVGDWIMIESVAEYVADRGLLEGEIAQVLSTADGMLNLNHPLFDGYAIADTAKVTKLSVIENVRLIGPSILGGGSGSSHAGITVDWGVNIFIENPLIIDAEERAIQFYQVVDFEVSGGRITGSNKSGYGYGTVMSQACQYGKIHHVLYDDCRNSIDFGGESKAGITRYVTVENNTCISASLNGINCHASVGYIELLNNTIIEAGQDGIGSLNSQIRIEGNVIIRPAGDGINSTNADSGHNTRTVMRNNRIEYPGIYGINVGLWATKPSQDFIRIVGNEVLASVNYGINVRGLPDQDITDVEIKDNKLIATANRSIFVDYFDGVLVANNYIKLASNTYGVRLQRGTNVMLAGNYIMGPGISPSTIAGVYVVAMGGVFTIEGNTVTGFAIGIQTADNLGLVTGNLVHGNTDGLCLGISTVSGGDNLNEAGTLE